MKKVVVFLAAFVLFCGIIVPMDGQAKAGKKFTVKVTKCVDGDTAWFSKVGKARFLYVDTPESTNKIQPYGKTTSKYVCSKLKKAKKIQLQYDGTKKDKYGRTLVWVWTDGKLLQKELIKKGYVRGFYDYGNYSYEKDLKKAHATAKKKKVGIWSNPKKNLVDSIKKTPAKKTPAKKVAAKKYKNCTELRKDYPNGVPKSHKAYEAKMDRDKDNYACEK